LGGLAVEVEDGDRPAVAGQPVGGGAPDATRGGGPGDDRGALGGERVVGAHGRGRLRVEVGCILYSRAGNESDIRRRGRRVPAARGGGRRAAARPPGS